MHFLVNCCWQSITMLSLKERFGFRLMLNMNIVYSIYCSNIQSHTGLYYSGMFQGIGLSKISPLL